MSGIDDGNGVTEKINTEAKASEMIFTVPNIISFARILMIIPFVVFFLKGEYVYAFSFIIMSGISDCLDGFLARKLNQISELGKLLDPIADKLTLVAVILCLGTLVPPILPLVIALVLKDLLMLLGGYYLLRKGITPPPAKWYGKVATVIFYISVVTIVFCKGILEYDIPWLTGIMMGITFIAMMFSLAKYAMIFLQLLKEQKNKPEENK